MNWKGWILAGLFAAGCGGGGVEVPNYTSTPEATAGDAAAEESATLADSTAAPTATPAPTAPPTPEPTDALTSTPASDTPTQEPETPEPDTERPEPTPEPTPEVTEPPATPEPTLAPTPEATATLEPEETPSIDNDGDRFGANEDCDDSDAQVHPGADEECDKVDDDCDGQIDEDLDGCDATPEPTPFPTPESTPELTPEPTNEPTAEPTPEPTEEPTPVDEDEDFFPSDIDCDDEDSSVYPEANELCDGKDNDCDGVIDEDPTDPAMWFKDGDGDGFGLTSIAVFACDQPTGYAAFSADCNDSDASVYPGAAELCDGKDNDCNGQADEDVETITWYLDQDGDGYGGKTTTVACSQPPGYERIGGDCDDADSGVHPFAEEACDGEDDDCDGQIDDGFDKDVDGFTTCAGDCNDASAAIHPGATDACNGVDEDCDGVADDGSNNTDVDGDGFSFCAGDCDDWDSQTHPGATETCNDEDDDCDGVADDGLDCIPDDLNEDLSWARVDGRAVGLSLEEVFPSSVTAGEVCVTGSGVNSDWDCDSADLVTLEDGFLWYDFVDGNYRVTWYSQVEGQWARYDDKCLDSSTDSVLCYANSGAQGGGFSLCFSVTSGVVAPLPDATCVGLN